MKSAVLAEPLPDLMRSVVRVLRYKTWLAAEILFLCKQLVLYYEQKVRPRPNRIGRRVNQVERDEVVNSMIIEN